ncbi:unannotated protein [freshwater metagenome]|uniref:Unannotated protein n=1 Tax=freshwater metagenome TaxID=449393 RepID=A0A6J7ED55_9ZZZZ
MESAICSVLAPEGTSADSRNTISGSDLGWHSVSAATVPSPWLQSSSESSYIHPQIGAYTP